MTIEEAIEYMKILSSDSKMFPPMREAAQTVIAALRAQQEAKKNEQPARCDDCMYWEPIDALGGPSLSELERLGKCRWIRGCIMASDFCSRGKRRPPEKEAPNG